MRVVWKWLLGLAAALLALAVIYVAILVYPSPFFSYQASFDDYRVYSDEPIPDDFDRVIAETARRVDAMEHRPYRAAPRIYLCNDRKRYDFFATLLRMNPESLAIGVSVPNEVFLSMTRIREFRESNAGLLRHTRFEGNVAEVIAHEIAHFNSLHALGYRAHVSQPVWKSEGWAEYQANLAAIRDDPAYDLAERIDRLGEDRFWDHHSGQARAFWEWQLLAEFLGEIEQERLDDLVAADVTLPRTRQRMMAWHRERFPRAAE